MVSEQGDERLMFASGERLRPAEHDNVVKVRNDHGSYSSCGRYQKALRWVYQLAFKSLVFGEQWLFLSNVIERSKS